MHEIIPAILPRSEEELKKQVSELPSEITFFHFDVLEKDIWTEVSRDFEAHLMVDEVAKTVETWIERGAKRLIVHKVDGEFAKYRSKAEIGLGVELQIPLEKVMPLFDLVDFVQLMSIAEMHEQGHSLDERIYDRIRSVRKEFPNLPISIDGGVRLENYEKLLEAGATRVVVGAHFSELWNSLKKN
jgi:pentose-5-phosphate-3-epimerase